MRCFIIEWWCYTSGKYQREYITNPEKAFQRYMMIDSDILKSAPEIYQIHIETD